MIPRHWRAPALLVGLVAAAGLLRLVGLAHELPQHPDEDALIVTQAQDLRRALAGDPGASLDPHYPLLLAGALALWPPPASAAAAERADPLGWHLERAALGHRRARLLVALLSTLLVPLTWAIARRFVEPPWALFAAALSATSLLHLQLAQSARPHGALASAVALALWLDLRLLERGRWREHLLAGAGAALALCTLHSGASALVPLGAAQWVRLRKDGRSALPRALAAWALVLAAAWLAYAPPLPRTSFSVPVSQGQHLNLSEHHMPLSVFDGGGFARMLPLLAQTDPVLVALALCGLVLALVRWARRGARPRRAAGVLCAWALPFLLVLGCYGRLPSRFLLPLLPLLALLSALALRGLAASRRRWVAPLVAVLALALPSYACVRLAWLRTRPEAAEELARWLAQHADRERDLLYLDVSANPPILMREEGGGTLTGSRFLVWDDYQTRLDAELLQAHGWRTRRLLARDPATGRVRQDRESLLALLRDPPAEPVRRRLALIAFDDAHAGRHTAWEAVVAAGGRALWSVHVLAGEPGDAQLAPLRAEPPETLRTLLSMRRLGFSSVVFELPPAGAQR